MNNIEAKCKCVPNGRCLRCVKMTLEAHSEGYDHALKDAIKSIKGKKPTDRSKCKLFEELTKLLTQQREEAVKGFAHWCESNKLGSCVLSDADEYLSQQREKGEYV